MRATTFTAAGVAALGGPDWLRARRAAAFGELEAMPMPSEKDEVWRYTPIDELLLDRYAPAGAEGRGRGAAVAGPADARAAAEAFAASVAHDLPGAGAVVTVCDGRVVGETRIGEGVALRDVAIGGAEVLGADGGAIGSVVAGGDVFVRLNDAFHPDAVVLDVPPGVVLDAPVLVVHWCSGAGVAGEGPAPATFPRTLVRAGRGSSVSVVEVVGGAPGAEAALVVPVTELAAGEGAQLSYVGLQVLGLGAWHVARVGAVAGRDATVRTFTVGLGGAYDRSRTDSLAGGPGASAELRSAYLGTGTQVHDVRTLQDHAADHTTSDLLCKGAVSGASRSVYSGLIRVRKGAVRTDAYQTNQNLVLDRRAHADSVPNLDIEENDVRCSHASTVGPVDEDQRYYLESRGVPPDRAERLIVLGFFEDIVRRSPVPAAANRIRRDVAQRLEQALAGGSRVEEGAGDG